MAKNVVTVNVEKCRLVARAISPLRVVDGSAIYVWLPEDRETEALLFFYVTAICHQTRKLVNKKENLAGWEYLKKEFALLAKENPDFLKPKNLALTNREDVQNVLLSRFSEDGRPEHSCLARSEERARFLIDCADVLEKKYGGSLQALLDASGGRAEVLYELLWDFEAYRDPLRKKASLLIRCLSQAGLFVLKDPENFVPIVDYHIMRVMFRTGCITVQDPKVLEALRLFRKMKDDYAIRSAAHAAVRIIAEESGKTLFEIDDMFWALGRSCCFYRQPLCKTGKCSKKPCTFAKMTGLKGHWRCVLDQACLGAADDGYRKLNEPNVNTSNY